MKEIIATKKAPAAIGPYSQAVKVGNTIYVSGQLPINPDTSKFEGDLVATQTKQSIENVKAILESKGFSLKDVVKTTVLLNNISDFKEMNEVYGQYFKDECPARASYEVSDLPLGALVEIEAIASK